MLTRHKLGVHFVETGTASVRVWAPEKESVQLDIIDGLTIPLEQEEHGYWYTFTNAVKPGTKYYFNVDGKKLPDPASLYQPQGVHGPSCAIDLKQFTWTDSNWQQPDLESYIIYELHVGTFTPEGTFDGVINKLSYLKDLGITAIEIMPIAQFPGNRNWGYDGVFPYAVQNSYGGANGLQRLVNACHNEGIAAILDVVYNHIGPEGNYLPEYGHYFTDKYKTPWGQAVNYDDTGSDEVRNYVIENAMMWFRDFHIDALRLDAVHAIKDLSAVHLLAEIKTATEQLIIERGKQHYLIAECDLNDPQYILPLSEGGYGMDAQWVDEFHHSLRVATGNKREGYYSDFNGIKHLEKSYNDAYVYDGIYSEHRAKTFGKKADKNPGRQFVVFSQNHDQIGNRMLGERTSQLVSFEMQKLMAGAVLIAPFLPLLFMGEEYSESHPFQYFVSHTDPKLAEAVRKGRKEEFKSFHLEGEVPDPMDTKTFENSKLQWNSLTQPLHKSMFQYYKDLIHIRKTYTPLNKLERKNLRTVCDKNKQLLIVERWHGAHHVVCYLNFSKERISQILPSQYSWELLMRSSDYKPGKISRSAEIHLGSAEIELLPESIVIFKNH